MRPVAAITLLISAVVFFNGCSSKSADQPAAPSASSPSASAPATSTSVTPAAATPDASSVAAKPSVDACTLLTSEEIKAVQGEAIKGTKASDRATGDFIVTQCYYELPTMSNSISLTLTENNSAKRDGESVRDFWERTFGKEEKKSESEREREREREKRAKAEPEREEEEEAPMEPVRGVGDEAFWSASRVGGALYVLKKDRFIRISVGGKGDNEAKLRKSKTLARKALAHL
jgi:Protein of unknown function (DUF3558)